MHIRSIHIAGLLIVRDIYLSMYEGGTSYLEYLAVRYTSIELRCLELPYHNRPPTLRVSFVIDARVHIIVGAKHYYTPGNSDLLLVPYVYSFS